MSTVPHKATCPGCQYTDAELHACDVCDLEVCDECGGLVQDPTATDGSLFQCGWCSDDVRRDAPIPPPKPGELQMHGIPRPNRRETA